MIQRLSILGAGLLGASLMQAAKARGVAAECVAWSRSEATRAVCRKADYCDAAFETPQEAVAGADVVVACVPVDRIVPLLAGVVPHLKKNALLTDVGSAKAAICAEADASFPPEVRFAGSHPMAGSELNGIAAARADLFEGHLCFVADDARSRRAEARDEAAAFWHALGMRVRLVDPNEHDAIVAHVSHLPHAVAVALSSALAEKPAFWRSCGAGGLRDTTRVSAGDPEVWRAIFEENRNEILPALDAFAEHFDALRSALRGNDSAALLEILASASAWRRPLSLGGGETEAAK